MSEDLDDEYKFDYQTAKPNRFASQLKQGGRMVVLEPEIAAVFRSSEEVNALLRAVLRAMPSDQKQKPLATTETAS